MRRPVVVMTMVAAGLVGGALSGPSAAHAHAVLLSTDPFDGEALEAPPGRVTLEFSEAVTTPLAGVRVFDTQGRRVDIGDAGRGAAPHLVDVGLDPGLGTGTYVVTWRAVSADSHPVRGAFLFEVRGEGGSSEEVDDAVVARLLGGTSDPGYEGAAAAARFLQYAGILVAAGGALFLVAVHDGDGRERPRYVRISRRAAGVAAVAIVVAIPIQAALATGLGRDAVTNGRALADVVGGQFGWGALVGLLGLGLLAVGLRTDRTVEGDVVALVGGALAVASLALVGHPISSDPTWLVVGADAVHAGAGAAWVGGLFLLGLTLKARADRVEPDQVVAAAGLVRRFSTIAGVSVVVVAGAGGVLAWSEVRAVRALTSTQYGAVLLAKVAVVGLILGVAGFNRFRLVPAITRRASESAWRFLRATVRVELAGVVIVIVLTTALVNLVPAKTEAGVIGVFSGYADLGDTAQVNVVVDPNRSGHNEIHLYLIDGGGRPADLARHVEIRLLMPARDIGPITREPERAGPGHWIHAGQEFSISGEWEIQVVAQTSEFEQERASIGVFVN